MKAYRLVTTTLIIILGTQSVSAQYFKGLSHLYYTNSTGEKGVTTYIYNGRSTPYKAIWELKDGTRHSVNMHTFDSSGNMVYKNRVFSDSVSICQEFKYNRNNKLEYESFKRSDGLSGEATYIYSSDGRLNKTLCNGLNGWLYGTISYNYNNLAETCPASASLSNEDNDIAFISYNYDAKGRLMEETWNFINGFKQSFRYEYLETDCTVYRSSNIFIPNSCEYRISKEDYDYNGQGGGPSYYSYDRDGKLTDKVFIRSDGLKTTTDYSYSGDGRLEESCRKYSDGKTAVFSYVYNKDGLLEERTFKKSDGTEGYERYEYDEPGRLTAGEYLNFDGWLSGKLQFSNNIYDKVVKAYFVGSGGLDAKIAFLYDSLHRPVKIHWDFSNGTTQTYSFEYHDYNR